MGSERSKIAKGKRLSLDKSLLLLFSHSVVSDSAIPWTAACQPSLSFTISWCLLKLTSIEWMMPSNHLILCHPLLLKLSIFSSIRVFSNELALHIRWPKYCSFSISASNEYSGLTSLRINWFDLLDLLVVIITTITKHTSAQEPLNS